MALSLHHERIRASTDETFAEALAQFRGNLGGVEDLLRETAETVTTRSLSDLELRVETLKQQTVEDLVKSAEWYEKRAQTQTQTAAEKVSEVVGSQLRETAADIASELTTELDQSSRNITYAQNQMAESSARPSRARPGPVCRSGRDDHGGPLVDEIQRHARQDLEGFESELKRSSVQTRGDGSGPFRTCAKSHHEQETFAAIPKNAARWMRESRKPTSACRPGSSRQIVIDDRRNNGRCRDLLANRRTGRGTLRERLDNVSNQWMLATVALWTTRRANRLPA